MKKKYVPFKRPPLPVDVMQLKLDSRIGNLFKIIKYSGADKRAEFKCLLCNKTFTLNSYRIIYRYLRGCTYCRVPPQTLDIKEVQKRINKTHGRGKIKVIEYKTNDVASTFYCKRCETIWNSVAYNVYSKGIGCSKCSTSILRSESKKKTAEHFQNRIDKVHGKNSIKILEKGSSKNKSKLKCVPCGNIWYAGLGNVVTSKTGCPKCNKTHKISKSCTSWIRDLEKMLGRKLQHHTNGGEYRPFQNKRMSVDAYCIKTNTIYEYLGDAFHGNPELYSVRQKGFSPFNKDVTAGYLQRRDIHRFQSLIDLGFKVRYIYENDVNKGRIRPKVFKDGQKHL